MCMDRMIKVDGKERSDFNYPTGLMDVITLDKTKENFRMLYDHKGRFCVHRIDDNEKTYKLCKVKRQQLGPKGVPFITTHDGRTINYPNPRIKVNDTVRFDIESGNILEHFKFDVGQLVMVIGGQNVGRIGIVESRERHQGSFDIIHVKDAAGNKFATRLHYVFVIRNGNKPAISLPKM